MWRARESWVCLLVIVAGCADTGPPTCREAGRCPEGTPCTAPAECASGTCEAGACTAAPCGLSGTCPGGTPCAAPAECASGACSFGLCAATPCATPGSCPTGSACTADADCASGFCEGVCSEGCDATHPCDGGLFCLRGPSGTECGETCDEAAGLRAPEGHACVGGVPVRCEDGAPEAACLQCLVELAIDLDVTLVEADICPAGTWCGGGTTEIGECVPQIAVGQACSFHAECLSVNCARPSSGAAGVCQEAAGTPCTDADCNWCDPGPGGTRVCSQNCISDSDCTRGSFCIGNRTTDQYACRVNCWSDPCPTGYTCTLVPTGSDSVRVCLP